MNPSPLPNKFALNRESPVPLYHQLLEVFYEYLGNDTWKSGDWIPSESELAREFNVSEITIRQPLLTLAREGRLVRTRGKGTRVANTLRTSSAFEFVRSTEPFWSFEKLDVRVLEIGPSEGKIAAPNPLGREDVCYIRRICSIDNQPIVFQTIFINKLIAAEIGLTAWANPQIAQILTPLFKELTYCKESVEAIVLSRYEAEIFNEQEGKFSLLVERTLYEGEQPKFFERIISRFGSLTFVNRFSRP